MARHAAEHRRAASRAARARGGENVLARLSELMFVEAIRRYLETLPPAQTAGSPACETRSSARRWRRCTATRPSRGRSSGWRGSSGVSRSVLAERFTEMVGQPPMQYLALWRMQLASRLLPEGGQVAAVADAVGYESEAAFSRAFKKLVGQAPATWRRGTASRGEVSLGCRMRACPRREG